MTTLSGKLALVTGTSRGYGRAIAQRLARDGALVAVHFGSDDAEAHSTIESIRNRGGEAFPVKAALDGSLASVQSLILRLDEGLAALGWAQQLDILVNNAAVSQRGSIEDTPEEVFDKVFAVDAKAPFFVLQSELPRMPAGGRIINISSQTSLIAFPGVAAYSMAKGALDRLTVVAAKHLASRGITVNAVLPGVADTDMNADRLRGKPEAFAAASEFSVFKRIAQVSDIADIVGFLASGDARWITGQLIDGGGGSGL